MGGGGWSFMDRYEGEAAHPSSNAPRGPTTVPSGCWLLPVRTRDAAGARQPPGTTSVWAGPCAGHNQCCHCASGRGLRAVKILHLAAPGALCATAVPPPARHSLPFQCLAGAVPTLVAPLPFTAAVGRWPRGPLTGYSILPTAQLLWGALVNSPLSPLLFFRGSC